MKTIQDQADMTQKALKNLSKCTIEWNFQDLEYWSQCFSRINRSNLLQCHSYGVAIARQNHQRINKGLIYRNGEPAGLVQILEAGIFKNSIHAIVLDRGPLWFDGYGSLEDMKAFLDAFSMQFPRRFGRKVRIIPEIKNSNRSKILMEKCGFRPASEHGYQTIWLDLRKEQEVLRKELKKSWRNCLSQAERKGLEITWSDEDENFSWLMKHYSMDKHTKGYDGPSVKTMIALAGEFSRGKNMLIGTAMLDSQPIAAILTFVHGKSATYQIGYSSEEGRKSKAHYLLLWSVLKQLKERKVDDFDLGGINEKDAKGVRDFKLGMGGQVVKTLGLYN